MGSIFTIIKYLRMLSKYRTLVPMIEEVISALSARDWSRAFDLFTQLIDQAGVMGVLEGGPIKLTAAPSAIPDPTVAMKLDDLAKEFASDSVQAKNG